MDTHKRKPWHGLREFLKEYVIIVVGVLTALGAEQAVESMRWQHEVRVGREHLREEISFDELVYAHRVDVASCVQRNLSALKTIISSLRSDKPVDPIPEFTSPENGPVRHEIWNSLSASQVLVHFPKDELQRYSQFYQEREDDEYFMDRESRAWRRLHLLEGDPTRLSKQEIGELWVTAGEADEMSRGVASISQSQVDLGRALGIQIPKPHLSGREECKSIRGGGRNRRRQPKRGRTEGVGRARAPSSLRANVRFPPLATFGASASGQGRIALPIAIWRARPVPSARL